MQTSKPWFSLIKQCLYIITYHCIIVVSREQLGKVKHGVEIHFSWRFKLLATHNETFVHLSQMWNHFTKTIFQRLARNVGQFSIKIRKGAHTSFSHSTLVLSTVAVKKRKATDKLGKFFLRKDVSRVFVCVTASFYVYTDT